LGDELGTDFDVGTWGCDEYWALVTHFEVLMLRYFLGFGVGNEDIGMMEVKETIGRYL